MFYVYTGNRFNQILIFQTREQARSFLQRSTRHTSEQIEKEIKEPVTTGYITSIAEV